MVKATLLTKQTSRDRFPLLQQGVPTLMSNFYQHFAVRGHSSTKNCFLFIQL